MVDFGMLNEHQVLKMCCVKNLFVTHFTHKRTAHLVCWIKAKLLEKGIPAGERITNNNFGPFYIQWKNEIFLIESHAETIQKEVFK